MKNIWVLYLKELKSYFSSWIAYVMMAFYAIIFGWFFWVRTSYFVSVSFRAATMGRDFPMDLNEMIIRALLTDVCVVGLFIAPMITMRLFAQEKGSGTIELLMTSPVRDWEIIISKWVSALTMYAVILGVSALNLAYLFVYGKPDWRPLLVGYLGLLLQGGCMLAIGTFVSSLTRNQIIAVFVTFAVCLLLWVIGWITAYDSSAWGSVLSYISIPSHFENLSKGVLETRDILYYLSVIFLGLFLTERSMESLRWRA
jgi:ABC-2 type transport system permease protein